MTSTSTTADAVSRIDGDTGAVTPFAKADAIKLHVAADGSVYGVEGSPSGGRVVRIAPDGSVIDRGRHRLARPAPRRARAGDPGPAERGRARPDGAVLFTQVEPVAAVRRVDPTTQRVTTLARGR